MTTPFSEKHLAALLASAMSAVEYADDGWRELESDSAFRWH